MADQVMERIYIVPLRRAKLAPRTKRANRAVSEVRSFIAQHMKADEEKVWLDNKVNEALWAQGIEKPPQKIRVKAVKFDDGLVEVAIPEA